MSKRALSPGPLTPKKRQKKLQYDTKYSIDFEKKYDWVRKSDCSATQAFCSVCQRHFSVSHGGIDDVRRHGEGKKQSELYAARKNSKDVSSFFMGCKHNTELDTNVMKAETLFSIMIAEHNAPFLLADHFNKIVKRMFPDSEIAKKYACGRMKTTQIVKRALDPIQRSAVIEYCQTERFSLLIDESNDHNDDKGLVILLRVTEAAGVVTRFLDMPIVNIGTGENIFNAIDNCFRKNNIPWNNLIAFTSDNCNVMMGKGENSVLARIKRVQPAVLDIGCICHLANLCAQAAVKTLPVKVDDLLIDIFYHFQNSSKRRENLKEFEHFTETEPLKILRHATTRWLSLERCVKRTLLQWNALYSYFHSHPESEKTGRVNRVAELLGRHDVRLLFIFLSFILGPLNEFNTAFQTSECSIGSLVSEMNRLLRKFLAKFVKMDVIKQHVADLTTVPFRDRSLQHNNELLAVGTQARLYLSEIKENMTIAEENKFFSSVRVFYETVVGKMIEKFPFRDESITHLGVLNPHSELKREAVISLAKRFSLVEDEDIDNLNEELLDYELTPKNQLPAFKEDDRVDIYWLSISKMKTGAGKLRFPLLGTVMKALITIPNSNADSERVFSMVRKIHTDFRSELENDTICALLSVKINLDGDCYDADITNEHLKAAKKATWGYVQDRMSAGLCTKA